MITKPGQGFRLGGRIKIKAIPFPLPAGIAAPLIDAAKNANRARMEVERIKEGCSPQKDAAVEEYETAMAALNTAEVTIRHACGVEYFRQEILPIKGN